MTNVTNHWNASVSYGRDHTGLVREVGGAGYAGVSTYASNIGYRAWGAVKAQTYGNSRQLLMQYDNRMRLTRWEVPGINALEYGYDHFYENGGRVTYARNLSDPTLDRSSQYDQVGRLSGAYTGSEARAHLALPGSGWGTSDGPYANLFHYDGWGNLTWRDGWVAGGVGHGSYTYPYANNRNSWLQYDAAGNLTGGDGANYSYDASGQQTLAHNYPADWNGYTLQQMYDGDRLRVKKVEGGVATYFVRSSVMSGQVVAEVNAAGQWTRGYVYDGGAQLLAIQQGGVTFVHQDPVTKSQRFSDTGGGWVGGTELDPWGGKTNRDSGTTGMQPRKFTTYDRDDNGRDQAMHRSYSARFSRFDQPDPADSSYDLSDPQSFNRYAYVQNDPVNFVDPSGLDGIDFGSVTVIDRIDQTIFTNDSGLFGLIFNQLFGGRQPLILPDPVMPQTPQNPVNVDELGPMPQSPCEQSLAALFGGPGAVMRTMYDVDGQYRGRNPAAAARFNRFDRDPVWGNKFFDAEHLYNFPHLSGNRAGTENTELFIPGNYVRGSMTGPTRGDGVVTAYYRQLGNRTNVTLAVFHVNDFGTQRDGGRVRIGTTGGPGGGKGGRRNLHAHFELWNGNTGFLSPGHGRDAARTPFTPAFCP